MSLTIEAQSVVGATVFLWLFLALLEIQNGRDKLLGLSLDSVTAAAVLGNVQGIVDGGVAVLIGAAILIPEVLVNFFNIKLRADRRRMMRRLGLTKTQATRVLRKPRGKKRTARYARSNKHSARSVTIVIGGGVLLICLAVMFAKLDQHHDYILSKDVSQYIRLTLGICAVLWILVGWGLWACWQAWISYTNYIETAGRRRNERRLRRGRPSDPAAFLSAVLLGAGFLFGILDSGFEGAQVSQVSGNTQRQAEDRGHDHKRPKEVPDITVHGVTVQLDGLTILVFRSPQNTATRVASSGS